MENFDLTKTEGRIGVLKQLNGGFKQILRKLGLNLHQDALVEINASCIKISIKDTDPNSKHFEYSAFGSEIVLYCEELSKYGKSDNTISFGTCGSFDPLTDTVQVWKAKHVASLLEHWKDVSKVMSTYCLKYQELCERIEQLNKK